MDNVPRFTLNATDTSCASASRNSPLHLSRILYKSTFLCKTNPILSAVGGLQMNLSIYSQTAYKNISNWTLGENKPNSNPNKPNCRKGKIDAKSVFTKDYRKNDVFAVRKNKPNPSGLRCLPRSPSMRRRMTRCRTDQTQSRNNFRAPMIAICFVCRNYFLDLRVLI